MTRLCWPPCAKVSPPGGYRTQSSGWIGCPWLPLARSTKYNCEQITDKCRASGVEAGYRQVQKEMSLASKAKTAVKKSSKAEQRAEMMEQILDVAELLFSKHGFYGVTLKDVAKQVGVHHTLLNYYFDDKQTLFDAVFARRAVVTIEKRMKALDDYDRAAGDSPTVEGALHAFLDTDLDLYIEGGEGWKNYGAFGAQASNSPDGAEYMDKYFDPVVLRLIEILKKALPDSAEEDIFWG